MITGPEVILTLKVLVASVTVILAASLVAIATGRRKLHGRLNILFFVLVLTTVLGFELLIRFGLDMTTTFSEEARAALRIHLYFAIPTAVILPLMLLSGIKRRRSVHLGLGSIFLVLWAGTFVTGLFFLPHSG